MGKKKKPSVLKVLGLVNKNSPDLNPRICVFGEGLSQSRDVSEVKSVQTGRGSGKEVVLCSTPH